MHMVIEAERGAKRQGEGSKQHHFIPRCTGNKEVAQREYDAAKKWAREYAARKRNLEEKKTMHCYKDIQYTVYCEKCGLYFHRLPRFESGPHARDTRGLVKSSSRPWGPVQLDIQNRGLTLMQRHNLYNGLLPGG